MDIPGLRGKDAAGAVTPLTSVSLKRFTVLPVAAVRLATLTGRAVSPLLSSPADQELGHVTGTQPTTPKDSGAR